MPALPAISELAVRVQWLMQTVPLPRALLTLALGSHSSHRMVDLMSELRDYNEQDQEFLKSAGCGSEDQAQPGNVSGNF